MTEKRIIKFFKKMGLYNKEYFNEIKEKTIIINSMNDNDNEFFGVYVNESNEFKVVLPYIENIFDELVWVHEYTHLLFLDDESEIFPNIMESYFVNMFCNDKEEIIKRTKEEIDSSVCKEHTLSKKIKLRRISK